MSLKFDMVINCDLKEDISEDAVEAIKYLIQPDYELTRIPDLKYDDSEYPNIANIWDIFGAYRFLVSDPNSNIISNFRKAHRLTIPLENNRDIYRYRLQYCGSSIHDDLFYQCHIPFVYWLATISYEDYIGYYMETHSMGFTIYHLKVKDGKLITR